MNSKKVNLIIAFSIISFAALAQGSTLERMEYKLSKYQNEDRDKVDLLNAIIYEIYEIDTFRADSLVQVALELEDKLNLVVNKAETLYYKAYLEKKKANYSAALLYFNQSLSTYDSLGQARGISYTLNGIGNVYYAQGDFNKAIEYYKKSYKTDLLLNDPVGIAGSLTNIANIYAEQGKQKEALEYYLKSLEIQKDLKNEYREARNLINIGVTYTEMGDFPKALEFFNKAVAIYEKPGNTYRSFILLESLGVLYKEYKEYDKALYYFNKGLEMCVAQGMKKEIASYLSNIGNVHNAQSNYDKALGYYNEALKIAKQINDKSKISRVLNNIAGVEVLTKDYEQALKKYKKAQAINETIGYKKELFKNYIGIALILYSREQYEEALEYALKSQQMVDEMDLLPPKRNFAQLLAKIYEQMGDFEKAYESYLLFKVLDDSLNNHETIKKISKLEYDYIYKARLDSAKKRELILVDEVKTKDESLEESQRQTLVAITIFFIVVMMLGIIILSLRLRNIQSINQSILIEQKLLRSQMTPHFIFNAMSVLQGIILNKEYKKSIVYLSKFSRLLRLILENSRDKTVLLEKEISAIENYLNIQNMGAKNEYDYHIIMDSDIDQKSILIPPMMIQPFIENSIEHGFTESIENKKIDVNIQFEGVKLVCTIQDNGVGIDAHDQKRTREKESLSTSITKERLQIMTKEFKVPADVSIKDRSLEGERGTIVTLILPYKKTNTDDSSINS
ncbi:tetratricopeptide repeat protein [Reichenbachiella versicolor]|uniref:tetratricopeptide repeat protein n=1 Tax=Reichenbachiella versicolor TaxID=1821036 RepID=UPI0013A5B1C4|nr:tetratricopeptide repeat protein [Reichenbachiella versicolor]